MPEFTLQFTKDEADKFWAISLSGKSHTVVYGRIGTAGRTVTKRFGSTNQAKASHDNLIDSKLSKGYTHATQKTIRRIQAGRRGEKKSDSKRSAPADRNRKTGSSKPGTKKVVRASDDSVRNSWKRIEVWLATNAQELASSLDAGERAAKIRDLEKKLGRRLPKDFDESLRIHADSKGLIPDPCRSGLGYNHAFGLMPISEIFNRWKMLTDLYDDGEFDSEARNVKAGKGVVRQSWSASWIPFATNGGGDYFCIDLGPTWPGVRGQVIFFSHEAPIRPLIATSFAALLSSLASAYESDLYTIGDRHGPIRKKKTTFPDAKD